MAIIVARRVAGNFRYIITALAILIVLGSLLFNALEPVGYFDSLYWAVTTATTTGYGDILPTNPASKALANVLMVAGTITFAALIAKVLDHLQEQREKFTHDEQHELMCEVQALVEHLKVNVDYSENGTR